MRIRAHRGEQPGLEIGDQRGVFDHRDELAVGPIADELEIARAEHQHPAVDQQRLGVGHARRQANPQAAALGDPAQIIAHDRLVVLARGVERRGNPAPCRCGQRIDERECRIGADHLERTRRGTDPREQRIELAGIVGAVEAQQLDSVEACLRGPRGALPIAFELLGQPIDDPAVLDPHHQIVPGEVVVGKVDSAEPRHVVHHQQLLMVAHRIAERIVPHRVCDPHAYAVLLQFIEHRPGRARLGGERRIARKDQECVVQHVAGVVVDQHPPVLGGARANGMGNPQPRSIAFEGHRLDQHAPPRRRDVQRCASPEIARADQHFEPRQSRCS